MKTNHCLFGTFLLSIFLTLNIAQAANGYVQLTDREKALWQEVFGSDSNQTQPQATKSTSEDTVNISGVWVGYYEYDKPKGQSAGMFNAVIRDLGEQFAISFLEPRNTQGEYVQWALNTSAKRQGRYIEFTKVYGHNENTKIQYNLAISHQGSIMDGTWKIDDRTYGRAFFYKVQLQDLKNIKKQTIE